MCGQKRAGCQLPPVVVHHLLVLVDDTCPQCPTAPPDRVFRGNAEKHLLLYPSSHRFAAVRFRDPGRTAIYHRAVPARSNSRGRTAPSDWLPIPGTTYAIAPTLSLRRASRQLWVPNSSASIG